MHLETNANSKYIERDPLPPVGDVLVLSEYTMCWCDSYLILKVYLQTYPNGRNVPDEILKDGVYGFYRKILKQFGNSFDVDQIQKLYDNKSVHATEICVNGKTMKNVCCTFNSKTNKMVIKTRGSKKEESINLKINRNKL